MAGTAADQAKRERVHIISVDQAGEVEDIVAAQPGAVEHLQAGNGRQRKRNPDLGGHQGSRRESGDQLRVDPTVSRQQVAPEIVIAVERDQIGSGRKVAEAELDVGLHPVR